MIQEIIERKRREAIEIMKGSGIYGLDGFRLYLDKNVYLTPEGYPVRITTEKKFDSWLASQLFAYGITCKELALLTGIREKTIRDMRKGKISVSDILKEEFKRIFIALEEFDIPMPVLRRSKKNKKPIKWRLQLVNAIKNRPGASATYALADLISKKTG